MSNRSASMLALVVAIATVFTASNARADIIYVSYQGTHSIEKFTAPGVSSTFADTGLNGPFGLAFDTGGNLFAANFFGNTIRKITPGGAGSDFATSGLGGPINTAFDSTGNLYVSNQNAGTILKFTPAGVSSTFASGLANPVGLAFSSAGDLYVAHRPGSDTIEKINPQGVVSFFANTSGGFVAGLAFDAAGNLYASNNIASTIDKFTPAGVASLFANTGLAGPLGLAFDTSGTLYAANGNDNTIMQFTPAGVASLYANTGAGTTPRGLAIQRGILPMVSRFTSPPQSIAGGPLQNADVPNPVPSGGGVHVTFPLATAGDFSSTYTVETALSLSSRTANFTFNPTTLTGQVQDWDLTYTGTFTGGALVTFNYDPGLLPTGFDEATLHVFHFTNGSWEDLLGVVNATDNTITFTTDSFSPFTLGTPVPEPSAAAVLTLAGMGLLGRRLRGLRS